MRRIKALMIAEVMLILTGCEMETLPIDTEMDTLFTYGTQNESEIEGSENAEAMNTNELEQILPIDGEDWSLIVSYNIGDYDMRQWRITEDKTLKITARTKGLPEGTEVFIDHVHYDISTRSTKEGTNGIKQDEMDDTYHGMTQDGFYISDAVSYSNIFAIEGFSETLIKGYGWYSSYLGGGNSGISEEYVTETDLIRSGIYGECVQAVFDLNIKHPGDEYFRTVSVLGKVLIRIPKYTENSGAHIVHVLDENGNELGTIETFRVTIVQMPQENETGEVKFILDDGSKKTVPLLNTPHKWGEMEEEWYLQVKTAEK